MNQEVIKTDTLKSQTSTNIDIRWTSSRPDTIELSTKNHAFIYIDKAQALRFADIIKELGFAG